MVADLAPNEGPAPCLALRKREMAAALAISERTLDEWTAHDGMPHIKRGNVVLYPVDAVRKWLQDRVITRSL